jgi:hypothetical protein
MEKDVYQELARRAGHDADWTGYLLLVTACQKLLEAAPASIEQLESMDKKAALEKALELLGEAIVHVVTYDEFWNYIPRSYRPAYEEIPVRRRRIRRVS